MRTYSELIKIPDFYDRVKYLATFNGIGQETFGFERYLNQQFYRSPIWKATRDIVIARDNDGKYPLDLAHPDCPIYGGVIVHHLNPITTADIEHSSDNLLDPENLIVCSDKTHRLIHYGGSKLRAPEWTPRSPNDTCPWR